MQAFQIFYPGTHTAASGQQITFTQSDIDGMVRSYDPALHEAPIVIGHPETNGPAYGWIKSLSESGGMVTAEPHQLTEDFTEWVKAGHYKKRSASLYPPDHPQNPSPGNYYLRHVGFLGAQAPAIKGMEDPKFSAPEPGVLEFTADTRYTAGLMARLVRGLREYLIDRESVEKADEVLPGWVIEELEAQAREPDPEPIPETAPGFSQGAPTSGEISMNEAEIKAAQDKLKADQDALKATQDALKADQDVLAQQQQEFAEAQDAAKKKARAEELGRYLDGLVTDKRILPAHKAGLAAFMAGLDTETAIQFGEGDKQTADQFLRNFLENQPRLRINTAGDLSGEDYDRQDPNETAQDLSIRAQQYQEKMRQSGVDIPIHDAVTACLDGKDKD